MSDPAVILCGPAQGTEEEPYRCICCRRTFADIEQLLVSICVDCMIGNVKCRACRRRGVFLSDARFGTHWDRTTGEMLPEFDPEGKMGHRLTFLNGRRVHAVCGLTISREHADFGGGSAVIPPCPQCWPEGVMA